uniref:Cryptochrome/DNA photolyase FAD-binding domain-containing protein n=1 Tax=Strombidium rassoulzadegani TaxID=1082188 RepID=A0A7S3FTM4_9SPIT|mmetsp:Transcript_11082/g.18558  ORF Transcript_11082/g.18558 Transcript_11082/m.18558 type:complete len:322 (+) Transcript_11082:859-1824(+)
MMKESADYLPTLTEFGFSKEEILKAEKHDSRTCYKFVGGEDMGLKRLEEYITEKRSVRHYNDTRNNLIGSEYSSKLSPWLANGSLSIREIYHKTREFEKAHGASESTKVYIDELFWRDFNRFWCMRYANKVFSPYGIYDREYYDWNTDQEIVQRWREGRTGMPLIDSLMRDMNATGFMPNRGRMIVACYFTMDLKQDWRYGAHYFEEKLIDHDVQSNYGGWSFSSGIGPGRVLVFNSLKQSRDFDKEGKYIKRWCPELKAAPLSYIHDIWNLPKALQKSTGIVLGEAYPTVIKCNKYTNPEVAKKEKRDKAEQRKLGFEKK